MKKICVFFIAILSLFTSPTFAINIFGDTARNQWNVNSDDLSGRPEEFLIAGGIGKKHDHGTWHDEWAGIGIIAVQVVEHGGYFCPYQIQCANSGGGGGKSWTTYYEPTGFSDSKCVWLCEPGYSGTNCASSSVLICDEKKYTMNAGGRFSGVSLKTSGKGDKMCEARIYGFDAKYEGKDECDTLLGIVKFLEHGVIAGPVKVCCHKSGGDSYINSIGTSVGSQKLLCAEGYTANAGGNDCVPVDAGLCAVQNISFCANFDRSAYNTSIHYLDSSSGCVKYFCSEKGKAFARVGDSECVDCATGVKGGPNPQNGVCVVCQTGQFFDSKSGECRSAQAYSKIDLQYGKGKTKDAVNIKNQCWTKIVPDDYRDCVNGN